MYAIHDSDGRLISIGTVIADPLPDGLTAVLLSPADTQGLQDSSRRWDPATRTVIAIPGWVDPAIAEGNRATIEAQAAAALTDNTVYLAIVSPTNAQVLAQVRALTQQNQRLIRLATNRLEATT